MNCCDFDCHQGRDCPARGNPPAPTAPLNEWPDESDDSELMYLVSIAMAIVGASATFGFIVGYSAHRFF